MKILTGKDDSDGNSERLPSRFRNYSLEMANTIQAKVAECLALNVELFQF